VAHAVPAQTTNDSIVEAWWFRLAVRTVLVLLAVWALTFATDQLQTFFLGAASDGRYDNGLWLTWLGAMVAAGLLFGLAAWLPFKSVRFLPSRLLLAGLMLVPLVRFWWSVIQGHMGTGWLWRSYWFDGVQIQFVLAAFAGVALASAFQAKRLASAHEF
jgi:hypothetical protein